MKKLFYLFVGLTLLSSCATIQMSDLKPYPENSSMLPALEPRVDMNSFESVYSMGYSTGTTTGYGTSITKNSALGIAINRSSMSKDPRVQDAITIFDRDVKDNITNPFGDKKGYILCKIAAGGTKTGGYGWAFLSGITLMIPNIFGMPMGFNKTSLDIEVEIYDLNEKLIGRYNAQCYDKTWIAAYHGYSGIGPDKSATPAARISSIKAFKCAMNDIKSQIDKDYVRLNKELNK